jgi:hypothetical protein
MLSCTPRTESLVKQSLVIAFFISALATAWPSALPASVIYPSITPDAAAAYCIPVTSTFSFEGHPVTVSVNVDASLYQGAVRANKTVTRIGNAREHDWIDDYFPAFVQEIHHDSFYDDLLAEFRSVKEELDLDDDRYVELLTTFAQAIPYYTDPDVLEPKFPVETFVDGVGDCDDKTLLLAALLAREGYDVAGLLFEPEKHVALGIRTQHGDFEGTGYAYTETTTNARIGTVPEHFAGGVELNSEPRVFTIGTGTRRYGSGHDGGERRRAWGIGELLLSPG